MITGKRNQSAIGTLVGTTNRLPDAAAPIRWLRPEQVRDALTAKIKNTARVAAPVADLGPRLLGIVLLGDTLSTTGPGRAIECLCVLAMITSAVLIGRSRVLAPVEHESTGTRSGRVTPLE